MIRQSVLDTVARLGLKTYDHRFGKSSTRHLEGVLPRLVEFAALTILLCEYDGKILSDGGVRTVDQQRALVAGGTSWTMNSRHLPQADGYGRAVDIVALTNGKVDWKNLAAFRAMALAAQTASAILELPIRQGCDWDVDGILGESSAKEWDWPHNEEPTDTYMPRAIKLMLERRKALGLDVDSDVERRLRAVEAEVAAIREAVTAKAS